MKNKIYYRAIPKTNGDFYIKKEELRGRWKNCFLTEEEAIEHFTNAKKIAFEKYKKITDGINKLKEELGNFDFDCEVYIDDDSGLEVEMLLNFEVNGYLFSFVQ